MKYRMSTIVLIVFLLLILIVQSIQAAPLNPSGAASENALAPAGIYDFTTHGTAWVPQLRSKFSMFKPVGWGVEMKVKAAGWQWVHIPISYPSRMANDFVKIQYVEFCAQSSNGSATKPVAMDLWDYAGRFLTLSVFWAPNNDKQCVGYTFNPPVARQDLGISVKIKFANATDKITMYKAWVRVAP